MSAVLKDVVNLNAHEINTRFLNLEVNNKRLNAVVTKICSNITKTPIPHDSSETLNEPNRTKTSDMVHTTENAADSQSQMPRRNMTKTDPSAAANLRPNIPKPAALESPKQHRKPAVNGDKTQIQRTLDGTPMEQFSINAASNTNTPA